MTGPYKRYKIDIDLASEDAEPNVHRQLDVKAEPDLLNEESESKELEEDLKKLKGMKNSKIKKKKNMEFLPCTIRARLKPIGLELYDITLKKEKVDLIVPKAFLCATYGGSPMQVFPTIGPKFTHGWEGFMYLNPVFQPEAPQVPGAPGLYLNSVPPTVEEEGPWTELKRVFTKIDEKPSRSQYMGQYQVSSCQSFTKEEWASQTAKVRSTWARHITRDNWGMEVCARVRAWKELGHEPSKAEYSAMLETILLDKKKPTTDEIQDAYLKGEERMGVYTMKCVGYDNAFQTDVYEKARNWVPPPPKNSEKYSKVKNESAGSKSTAGSSPRGLKRKHSEHISDEDEKHDHEPEDELEGSDSGSERENPHPALVYRHRGTRSRPICP